MAPDMTEVIDDPIARRGPVRRFADRRRRLESPPPNRAATLVIDRVGVAHRPPASQLARTRPWPTERIVQYLTALIVVGGATFAVLKVVHLDLVFENNTPTGGDMGAHVMAPAYLRDHLLPHFQLSGLDNTGTPASRCTASTWSSRRW